MKPEEFLKSKNIKAIIFDAARVLVDFDTGIFVKAIGSHSSYSEEEMIFKIKNSVGLKKFNKGKISPEDFYNNLVGVLSLKGLTFEEFETQWKKIIFRINEGIPKILADIKPSVKLLVLANMDKLSWEAFINMPLINKYFHDEKLRMASFQVGSAKPEAMIYRELLKRNRLAFGQCLFIDDNQANLKQVHELGGNIIHYDCRSHSVDYLHKQLEEFNVFGPIKLTTI